MEEIPQEYKAYEGLLCKQCQGMLKQEMMPVYKDVNSGSMIRRQFAKARIVKMQLTLHKKFCQSCKNKIINKLKQEGKI